MSVTVKDIRAAIEGLPDSAEVCMIVMCSRIVPAEKLETEQGSYRSSYSGLRYATINQNAKKKNAVLIHLTA